MSPARSAIWAYRRPVPPYSGWREPILAHFTQEIATVARLTIVVDPDRLLTEETILDGIRERGFDLIPFEDQVAFRFAYETRYRRAWDRGEETNLVVLLHTVRADASALPFDLLEGARRDRRLLQFSRADLFPKLSPAVLEGYAAAKVLVEGLRRAGKNPTRETLQAALENMKRYDLGGLEVSFSPEDHTGLEFADLSIVDLEGRFVR